MGGSCRFTMLNTAGVADTEQYAGLANAVGSSAAFLNGYMIGFDGDTFGVHRFSNDVKTSVALADCDDPLNGNGASGMTIDHTKLNVFAIQYQYLGAGNIMYQIENPETGELVTFHQVKYANSSTVPSVQLPIFHFNLWVSNGGTTTDIVMKCGSFGLFIEGNVEPKQIHQPQFSSGLQSKASVQSEVALFTIRNKTTYASKANYIAIQLEFAATSIEANSANNLGTVRLVRNATLGGTPSYSDINTTDSVVEIDTAGTTVTGGTDLIPVTLAGKNDKGSLNLVSFKFVLKHGETLTFAAASVAEATIKSFLLWRELT